MTINLSNGLASLSLLTGTNSYLDYGSSGATESRAVRAAKAQFTTLPTTPPWKQAAATTPEPTQVSAIKRMATIVDAPARGPGAVPPDVGTAFTTYKALDRLRLLASTAAKSSTSTAERATLQAAFAKGLGDVATFLGTAPTDKVELSFAKPSSTTSSVAVLPTTALSAPKIAGAEIAPARDAPLTGLTGSERFRISLSNTHATDVVTVDLATGPQPPTLDSVAQSFNDAIEAVPLRNADGSVVLDKDGKPSPAWLVRFVPDKTTDKWGFALKRAGFETVEIDEVGAKDALMVATSQTEAGAPVATQLVRFDDPAGAMARRLLGTISAIDRRATESTQLLPVAKPVKGTAAPAPADIGADLVSAAAATDAAGFTYLVGTTGGDVGANRLAGTEDIVLSKIDSSGKTVWQRSLGASGEAKGAAVSIAVNGDVVVAGSVTGRFDGAAADGDLLVARYDANGDEKFATLIRSAGADSATAVVAGADGGIFVGGQAAGSGGDAFIARLDPAGRLEQRRRIDSGAVDTVTQLGIDGDGRLLALTRENGTATLRRFDPNDLDTELGSIGLGAADARALAVAADGSIAVGGATSAALPGAQVNGPSSGRDGFVARIAGDLSQASVTYLATAGTDEVDSLAFLDGQLYAGGRTTGDLAGARRGLVDGFVGRVDAGSGTLAGITQFGQAAQTTGPVRLAAAAGGASVLGALGLHRGALTPQDSPRLVAQTSLRPGDEFSVHVEGGTVRKIVIAADDTMATLAERLTRLVGAKATIATPKTATGTVLRITAKPGSSLELIAGAPGKDALAKLGLAPARLAVPDTAPANAPRVRPGGNFGLNLTPALNLSSAKDAAVALDRLKTAISTTQTAYRSLYWDAGKAAIVDGPAATARSAADQARLAQYQAALDRLSPASASTGLSNMWGF